MQQLTNLSLQLKLLIFLVKYLFFAKHKNFAVSVSDYRDYERVISEKAKLEINARFNVDIDEQHANSEIIKKSKGFLTS